MTSAVPESRPFHGLRRLLSQLGVETTVQALSEQLGPEPTPESLARAVRAHGHPARAVMLDGQALGRLPVPTLLLHNGSPHSILSHVHRQRAEVELLDGRRVAVTVSELARSVNGALDLSEPLVGLGGFWRRLLRILGGEERALIQLALLAVLLSGLAMLGPLLTRLVMDEALPNRGEETLQAASVALLLTGLHRAWMGFLRTRIALAIRARGTQAMVGGGLSHLLGMRFEALLRQGLGGGLQLLASLESAVATTAAIGIRPLCDGLIGLAAWVFLLHAVPTIAMTILVGGAIALVLSGWLAQRLAGYQRRQIECSATERARLHELLSGIATLKAAGVERRVLGRWLLPMIDQSVARLNAGLVRVSHGVVVTAAGYLARFAAFLFGAKATLAGEMSVGEFISVAMLVEHVVAALSSVGEIQVALQAARADISRIDPVLSVEGEPVPSPSLGTRVKRDAVGRDAVVLDDVWFRYGPDQPWILRGYSLRVSAGEQLVLRSRSGSGKTTVLRLIAGLHRPERGTVAVFGRDPTTTRAEVAYLPQQVHLFAGSLLHNLRLLSGASLERIVEACKGTGLHSFLNSLPMGLDTLVPAGGGNLSGGQRQWILLTAAVASERELLLLDESLSALDRLTRQRIREGTAFEDKSVIWVSHED